MMAAARVDLNGALIRPVEDPYYNNNQQGWGSPQAQPWWTGYSAGNAIPTPSSNTQQISGGSLIGNVIKQGWATMVSPRKEANEATTVVEAPTDPNTIPNSVDTTVSKPAETGPTTVAQPVAPKPPAATPIASQYTPIIATQQTIPPVAHQQTVMLGVTGMQQPPLIQQHNPLTYGGVVPNLGQPHTGAMPNGLVNPINPNTMMIPPSDLGPIILALKQSIESLTKEIADIKTQATKQPTIVATLSCGCPAPSGKSAGNCNCSTKTDASKITEETKPPSEIKK